MPFVTQFIPHEYTFLKKYFEGIKFQEIRDLTLDEIITNIPPDHRLAARVCLTEVNKSGMCFKPVEKQEKNLFISKSGNNRRGRNSDDDESEDDDSDTIGNTSVRKKLKPHTVRLHNNKIDLSGKIIPSTFRFSSSRFIPIRLLPPLIRVELRGLTKLNNITGITDNNTTDDIEDEPGAADFANTITIDLSNNRLGDADVPYIIDMLNECAQCTAQMRFNLVLDSNRFTFQQNVNPNPDSKPKENKNYLDNFMNGIILHPSIRYVSCKYNAITCVHNNDHFFNSLTENHLQHFIFLPSEWAAEFVFQTIFQDKKVAGVAYIYHGKFHLVFTSVGGYDYQKKGSLI